MFIQKKVDGLKSAANIKNNKIIFMETTNDNNDEDNIIEIIKQDSPIDHTEFKKYIATFDIILFGVDDKLIKLDKASCLFLAKNDETAKYRSCYEMFQTCLLEGMPIKSMDFVSVCVCNEIDINIDDMFPSSGDVL
jgi:hypothetical protein